MKKSIIFHSSTSEEIKDSWKEAKLKFHKLLALLSSILQKYKRKYAYYIR